MRAGQLDRVVTFERLTETVGATGAVTRAWAPLATVRASITDATSEETTGAPGEVVKARVSVLIRYLPGVLLTDRLTYEGRTFNIVSLVEIGRRKGLELGAVAP